MSMKTKRSVKIGLLSLFISISLLLSCMTVVRAFENDISIFVNGITIETDVPPQIENDRVLVPMRAIFETFGAQIEWNDEIKTVYAEKDKTEITVKIGDKKIIVNGEEKEIDTAAVIYGSRTLVPLRAISESFGYKCIWDEKQRSVRVLSFELPQLSETEYDKEVFTKIGSTEYSVSVANAYADMLSDGEKLSDETLKKKTFEHFGIYRVLR